MINFLIKFFALILCIGILIGGAWLTYQKSDLGAIKSDFDSAMATPWFPPHVDGQ